MENKKKDLIEHRHPTPATQKNVLAASGNQCAQPGCSNRIFDLEHETLLGTIAHIKARSEYGPRFDYNQKEEENRSFGNLLGLCGDHSKIIDGPKWKDFSGEMLTTWKKEHEERIIGTMDRSWIKPANSIIKMTQEGTKLQFTYWIDSKGNPRLHSKQQLAIINVLMSLNMQLHKICSLPSHLNDAKNSDIANVLQQSWAKFDTENSVLGDLMTLLAMNGNITFAELLGFLVEGNDPTPIINEGTKRLGNFANGEDVPLVRHWFKSDTTED